MLQRGFLLLMLVISFTGCAAIHKIQTRNVAPMPVSVQGKPVSDENEKVWVEAETKKVWINNYVDENGDMVEGHYKHIMVTPGHWAVKESGKK